MIDAPWMTAAWSRRERLEALAVYLPVLTDRGFKFGEWRGGEERDGALTWPWFDSHPSVDAFLQALYDYGWIRQFYWREWVKTPEGIALRTNPAAIDHADEDQLARLLTAIVRADRFCEGVLEDAFEEGLLTRVITRSAELQTLPE